MESLFSTTAGTESLVQLPLGPLTAAELAEAVPAALVREHYRRVWKGMYRRADQVDDLLLRSRALAKVWPQGVLCGRSAALLWGDDSAEPTTEPEIWLPFTRKACQGRRYRFGDLSEDAVTTCEEFRVTTRVRTCRDIASSLPYREAVVVVDRMCAAHPELYEVLCSVASHPAGRGAKRFRDVVAGVDPWSGSVEESRARVLLQEAGLGGFRGGQLVRTARQVVRPNLADFDSHLAVDLLGAGYSPDKRISAERDWLLLRRAGWTVIVASETPVLREVPTLWERREAEDQQGSYPGWAPTLPDRLPATRAAAALSIRWSEVEVLEPLAVRGHSADPHGLWAQSAVGPAC